MPINLLETHPKIASAQAASDAIISSLRASAVDVPRDVCVVANGSLARREITSQSDFDAYALYGSPATAEDAKKVLDAVRKAAPLKSAAAGGAFGDVHSDELLPKNIGGQKDDNASITRRMLFLLESVPVAGVDKYNDVMDVIIKRYISDDITHHQLGRFLLNDIIRYYRTMCVDFEFKTIEQKKSWGIRNIKLVFSRKLMYFSGIVMCAELAEKTPIAKRAVLRSLAAMSPIDRLLAVMGANILPALSEYELFLTSLDSEEVRKGLEGVELVRATHTQEYRTLKDSGHQFSWKLVNALRHTYPPSHPIHDALIM